MSSCRGVEKYRALHEKGGRNWGFSEGRKVEGYGGAYQISITRQKEEATGNASKKCWGGDDKCTSCRPIELNGHERKWKTSHSRLLEAIYDQTQKKTRIIM